MFSNRNSATVRLGVCAVGVLMIAMVVTSGCGGSSASETVTLSGEELVATRCHACHDTARIDAAVYDKAGWERTIGRMVGKGAKVSDAEKAVMVEYLANR